MKKTLLIVFLVLFSSIVLADIDIEIVSIEIQPEIPIAGDTIIITTTIRNSGNEPFYALHQSFNRWLTCEKEYISEDLTDLIRELQPGEEASINTKWKVLKGGECKSYYKLDSKNDYTETNENNNEMEIKFLVYHSDGCEETDDGEDYYEQGIVYFEGKEKQDYCTDEDGIENYEKKNYVKEYYCEENDREQKVYKCPYGCKEGACLSEELGDLNITFLDPIIECEQGVICNIIGPKKVSLYNSKGKIIDERVSPIWIPKFEELPVGDYRVKASFEYYDLIEVDLEVFFGGNSYEFSAHREYVKAAEIMTKDTYEFGDEIEIKVKNIIDEQFTYYSTCFNGISIEKFNGDNYESFYHSDSLNCGNCDLERSILNPGEEAYIGTWNQIIHYNDCNQKENATIGQYRITFIHSHIENSRWPQKEFTIIEKKEIIEESVDQELSNNNEQEYGSEDEESQESVADNSVEDTQLKKENIIQKFFTWLKNLFS